LQDITLKVDRTKTGYDIIVGKDTLSERERETTQEGRQAREGRWDRQTQDVKMNRGGGCSVKRKP